MPTILLIRHGENEYVKKGKLAGRLPGVHLNENGRSQAAKLAEVLAEAPIKAIYASPLDRTMETAVPIAGTLGLDVTPREGLLELDVGDWTDKKLKKLSKKKLWRTVQNNPSLMRFPNGETFSGAQQRIVNEIEALSSMHDDKDVIICVGHSDMIKLAAAYYLGLALDLFQRLTVMPASITTIFVSKTGSRVIGINQMAEFKFPKFKKEDPKDAEHKKEIKNSGPTKEETQPATQEEA